MMMLSIRRSVWVAYTTGASPKRRGATERVMASFSPSSSSCLLLLEETLNALKGGVGITRSTSLTAAVAFSGGLPPAPAPAASAAAAGASTPKAATSFAHHPAVLASPTSGNAIKSTGPSVDTQTGQKHVCQSTSRSFMRKAQAIIPAGCCCCVCACDDTTARASTINTHPIFTLLDAIIVLDLLLLTAPIQ